MAGKKGVIPKFWTQTEYDTIAQYVDKGEELGRKQFRELARQMGRTIGSVDNAYFLIHVQFGKSQSKSKNVVVSDKYKAMYESYMNRNHPATATGEQIHAGGNGIKHNNIAVIVDQTPIDKSLSRLEQKMNELREVIGDVIDEVATLRSENRVKVLKTRVEQLEQVVDAAKKSNFTTFLRNRLMGDK